jgi:hypothetical protein
VRARYHRRRQRLQPCATRNATRRLRRRGRRAARFQKATNHWISKTLVQKAVVARKARARAAWRGMRERTTVRRVKRDERPAWACFHLRPSRPCQATGVGVSLVLVDRARPGAPAPAAGTAPQTIAPRRRWWPARLPPLPAPLPGRRIRLGRSTAAAEQTTSGSQSPGLWRRPARGRCKPPALAVGVLIVHDACPRSVGRRHAPP